MAYAVELTRRAQKELASLERQARQAVAAFIDSRLEGSENPCADPSAKKLQGVPHGWRWRVGSWRILGVLESDQRLVIEVFRIGDRRDVYRGL